MRRSVWIGAAMVAAVAAGGAGGYLYATRQPGPAAGPGDAAPAFTAAFDAALAHQEQTLHRLAARFEQVDDLKTDQELRLRTYRNADHLASAGTLGTPVAGMDDVARLVAAGRLVYLEETPYYAIQALEHSVPYVTPDAVALLGEIGERFQAALRAQGLPRYRFVISSVLRTGEGQQNLRAVNPNATAGATTHAFGTTVDVVYHTYQYWPHPDDALPPTPYPVLDARLEPLRVRAYDALGMRYWQELQGLLGRVLIALQAEGKVKVTLEREQPVFHFTVARRYERRS
jgi:hypothetical protein